VVSIEAQIITWKLRSPPVLVALGGSELEGPFAGVEAAYRIVHCDWLENEAKGSNVDTYFGMSLFALEASFSRLGVSLALCDALFRHSGDDESSA